MTNGTKVWNIITGLIMIAAGGWLFYDPTDGLKVVAIVLSISCTFRGFQILLYYLTMARHMVSGKVLLYRGMIYLDIGVFTTAIINNAIIYIALYLAALHGFAGVVEILRARESKGVGNPGWKWSLISGLTNLLLAAAVLVGGLYNDSIQVVAYIYAAGIIYTACIRIAGVFRKTDIVYIQ